MIIKGILGICVSIGCESGRESFVAALIAMGQSADVVCVVNHLEQVRLNRFRSDPLSRLGSVLLIRHDWRDFWVAHL